MLQPLYSVHDNKAQHFLPPFTSHNDATAQRQFETAVNTHGHDFNIHPSDYSLHKIGSFTTESGQLECEGPLRLCGGLELLAAEPLAHDLNPI